MTRQSSKPAHSPGPNRALGGFLTHQHTLGSYVCVQREASGPGVQPDAALKVRNVLNSSGNSLDDGTRNVLEPRLGHDFSQVRVHSDRQADESAQAVRAHAYTSGNHVVFAAGKHQPQSQEGQRIMAHELTHVIQQSTGPVAGTEFAPGFFVSHPADPFERAAASPAPLADHTTPLPSSGRDSGTTHLQRSGLDSAGAIAGIVGGAAGVLGLGLAAIAYFRPPEALNPSPVTGGLSLNPNPFSFNTVQQTPAMPQVKPVPEKPSDRPKFQQAQRGAPTIHPVLDLRTDDSNHAVLNLAERHDGLNIVDASIRTGTIQKYLGGSRGASATINFSAVQTSTDIFTAKEDGAGAATPAAAEPAAEPAEVTVSYTGTNAQDQGAPQNFAGSFRVKADGSVDVADPEITNGVGTAQKNANVAFIDYRGTPGGASAASGSSSGPSIVSPSTGNKGFDPGQLLPINRPID